MEAQERSGELISAEVARATWASVATIVKTALLAVPSQAKQQSPRLTME
jgi:phage terminase Nu1 subunit (DNA packaging protein)